MMGGHGMKRLAHAVLHFRKGKRYAERKLRWAPSYCRWPPSLHKAGTWQAQAWRASNAAHQKQADPMIAALVCSWPTFALFPIRRSCSIPTRRKAFAPSTEPTAGKPSQPAAATTGLLASAARRS
jgi:hypothetical protein